MFPSYPLEALLSGSKKRPHEGVSVIPKNRMPYPEDLAAMPLKDGFRWWENTALNLSSHRDFST